ncbi:proproteinase E-like protein [Lates japonicus]|uniref:Proproteinase E-like protein n=1 Tax=Lates japonicus TaxID=270547 RepID=A0AAD3M8J5_LATJO|nr:proproteinase E-like protein [Lates japonicus]
MSYWDPRTYRVVLGEYDLTNGEGYEQVRAVERIIVHPGWNSNCLSCGNDIAMIKLASPAVLNDKVQPSCVPESGEIVPHNYPCYVTGWGRLYSGGPIMPKLQQAILPVVTVSAVHTVGSIAKTHMICGGETTLQGSNPASLLSWNDKVQLPLCARERRSSHNYPCYATGWWRLYSNGPISSKLQQALLPVVSNSICNSDWEIQGGPSELCGNDGRYVTMLQY